MTNPSDELIARSGYARAGFPETYDDHRPAPPDALLDALCEAAGTELPALVVDLGSGTGLSTRAWSGRAARVVGIEPNPAMRALASARTPEPNVVYAAGYGSDTGLAAGGADLVTCSQSFHWMEPAPTLAEAARILRPGGVFAAYDYDVPPAIHPAVDVAFECFLAARRAAGVRMGASRWPKEGHLGRIEASGLFRRVDELVVRGETRGGAERVVGFARSIGERVDSATQDELAHVAAEALGDRAVPWRITYRVRLGVR